MSIAAIVRWATDGIDDWTSVECQQIWAVENVDNSKHRNVHNYLFVRSDKSEVEVVMTKDCAGGVVLTAEANYRET